MCNRIKKEMKGGEKIVFSDEKKWRNVPVISEATAASAAKDKEH